MAESGDDTMMKWKLAGLALVCMMGSGCSALVAEGSSAGAAVAGGSLASAIGGNAGVAAGIGLGVQAAARAGVQYGQRTLHNDTQLRIASIAGPLGPGEVTAWETDGTLGLEPSEAGRVTVSRVISAEVLNCKEIVFSVDRSGKKALPASAFYVAAICRNGDTWGWASAEPATARWGALQ